MVDTSGVIFFLGLILTYLRRTSVEADCLQQEYTSIIGLRGERMFEILCFPIHASRS